MKKQTTQDPSIIHYLQLQPVEATDDSDLNAFALDDTIDLTSDTNAEALDQSWDEILHDLHGDTQDG